MRFVYLLPNLFILVSLWSSLQPWELERLKLEKQLSLLRALRTNGTQASLLGCFRSEVENTLSQQEDLKTSVRERHLPDGRNMNNDLHLYCALQVWKILQCCHYSFSLRSVESKLFLTNWRKTTQTQHNRRHEESLRSLRGIWQTFRWFK